MNRSPLVQFVVGGVQKGGTTALAEFLSRHPRLRLPAGKEAHVFDAPGFNDDWDVSDVDARYARFFPDPGDEHVVRGDATPIYVFHPRLVARIARYNPAMKWVLILRHPVERAVSHYRMERARGHEPWPFWPAMLLERWRLRGDRADDLSAASPLRRFSYRRRGDYAAQLDVLYRHFPAEQVLVLRNRDLAEAPVDTLRRVHRFLEVGDVTPAGPFGRVFEGSYQRLRRGSLGWRLLCMLMRRELKRARERYGLEF